MWLHCFASVGLPRRDRCPHQAQQAGNFLKVNQIGFSLNAFPCLIRPPSARPGCLRRTQFSPDLTSFEFGRIRSRFFMKSDFRLLVVVDNSVCCSCLVNLCAAATVAVPEISVSPL